LRAELDYRKPIDLGEELELVPFEDGGARAVGFVAGGSVAAVGRCRQLRP
jgi:hypothetical protein